MRPLLLAACLLTLSGQAFAQMDSAVQALDQSLFDTEPVEDIPEEEDAPPAPVPPPVIPPAATAHPPEPALEYDTALLQGLKKVTAETMMFHAPIDTPIRFGSLIITVKKCMKSRPEEEPENSALLLIQDRTPDQPVATAFSGWMFSSSPGISALEHPVYDITVIDCIAKKKP